VTKVYWGAVEGDVAPAEGVWEDWLRKIQDEPRAERAEPSGDGAKLAVLRYRVLQPCTGGTLVEFEPLTGRMHRFGCKHRCAATRSWAIRSNGSTVAFGPVAELPRERIIALHARSLTFLHPIRYEADHGDGAAARDLERHGSQSMLTTDVLDRILAAIPRQTIGVLGDLFLDRYLDLDAARTEPSIETGLDAYQVVSVRSYPGAAGTVINNLAALGAERDRSDQHDRRRRRRLRTSPGARANAKRAATNLSQLGTAHANVHEADALRTRRDAT